MEARNRLTTYVDDEMFEKVKKEARESGLNESSWIRMIITNTLKNTGDKK